MSSFSLSNLANYLTGEFDNQEQAMAEPVWYVHLILWHRPVSLFREDSLTLFAEQANYLYPDRPYRQRLLRLRSCNEPGFPLQVQYYAFKEPGQFKGAGANPGVLSSLALTDLEELPGCLLRVSQPNPAQFVALPPPDTCCYFNYEGERRQVRLGFEATAQQFLSYDTGVDIQTGKLIWGAIMGPYRFTKKTSFPTSQG